MIFGLDLQPLPEGYVPLEAITVIKCLADDGDVAISVRATYNLTAWEAVGMLTAALDQNRNVMLDSFVDAEEEGGE